MKNEEAIQYIRNAAWLGSNGDREKIEKAVETAVKAMKLEQDILNNGYSGKEAEFRIGGRLFGIREKAQ